MNASPPSPHSLIADPAYFRLKDSLIAWTGLAYYADKDRELAERIVQRLAKVGVRGCDPYLALLESGQPGQIELDALIADLTIGETFFFRHREMFDALRTTVIPDRIAQNQGSRQLRIWSAGCSTGAEAYTIAILLKRELAQSLAGWDITIVGTDINRTFLARAREGIFEEWAFRSIPEDVKRSCFTRSGNLWEINPEYKEGVSFQYHNLVTHPFPSMLNNLFAFDVILCRNVTIYFSQEIVRQLIGHFHQSLVEGGWLLVGHSEPNMVFFRSFRTVNAPGAVLYQKSEEGSPSTEVGSTFSFTAYQPQPVAKPTWEPVALSGIAPFLPSVQPAQTPATSIAPIRSEDADLAEVRSFADRGEWHKAEDRCREMQDRNKLNPRVYFYQGLVLEQMGRHADAESALRRVIYLDRSFVFGHYYLGLLLQKNGKMPQAALSFRNVLQILARTDAKQVFADGDGISAGELRTLTEMHLAVLEQK